jgi:hypothetical protein
MFLLLEFHFFSSSNITFLCFCPMHFSATESYHCSFTLISKWMSSICSYLLFLRFHQGCSPQSWTSWLRSSTWATATRSIPQAGLAAPHRSILTASGTRCGDRLKCSTTNLLTRHPHLPPWTRTAVTNMNLNTVWSIHPCGRRSRPVFRYPSGVSSWQVKTLCCAIGCGV